MEEEVEVSAPPGDAGAETVEVAPTPDVSDLAEGPEEVGEPCVPECTGRECGDDDGCGKPCIVDAGCKSNPPCALGVCDQSGVCAFQPQEGACDDGSQCTVGDFCSGGKCKAGPDDLDCSDDNDCTTESCDPVAGCSSAPNTLPCDDGDPCTKGDACSQGSCSPGSPNLCDDKNYCTTDWCEAGVGCHNDPVWDGTMCDDENLCTTGDKCLAGKCAPGVPAKCGDTNPCTVDTCNPATGCSNEKAADSTPCDDGDACTQADYCLDGKCIPSGEKDCNDFNSCTVDSCGAGGACEHEKLTGDFYCSDDDPCTEPDWCLEGECQPGPMLPGCQ
jgi:hypothetical protein